MFPSKPCEWTSGPRKPFWRREGPTRLGSSSSLLQWTRRKALRDGWVKRAQSILWIWEAPRYLGQSCMQIQFLMSNFMAWFAGKSKSCWYVVNFWLWAEKFWRVGYQSIKSRTTRLALILCKTVRLYKLSTNIKMYTFIRSQFVPNLFRKVTHDGILSDFYSSTA